MHINIIRREIIHVDISFIENVEEKNEKENIYKEISIEIEWNYRTKKQSTGFRTSIKKYRRRVEKDN